MNSSKPRLASTSDRRRLARLSRGELERLLVRARRAFEAFGASAGRPEDAEDVENAGNASLGPARPRPATATI
jgi:hypothetical protein